MSDRPLLTLAQVAARTGLSTADVHALGRDGRFPAPLPLGPWSFGWVEAEVERWLASRGRVAQERADDPA
ncbi:MAG: helix-turn-helix transcriptional regulator [Gammaproteobacteria bacterium]